MHPLGGWIFVVDDTRGGNYTVTIVLNTQLNCLVKPTKSNMFEFWRRVSMSPVQWPCYF